MRKLLFVAVAAGVAYAVIAHLRNRGRNQDVSANGSLGEDARRAVDDATERIDA